MNFCKQIYYAQNILLTCGIYITPNENSQCFLYHCDHQHILAYQMAGEKQWSFPQIAGDYVREYTLEQTLNEMLNDQRIEFKTNDITLRTGELLFVPYAISHKATNQSTGPSVHLTFAEDDITVREYLSSMAQEVLNITNFDERFFESIDLENPSLTFTSFEKQKAEESALQFFTKMKLLKFKFGSKATL